ncbi:hypothetical protein C8R45DRAFT_1042912 [Mycena sanguinolenta]|nr:hypothetical protein C8R45DRAFT_1042912 [Mycena sanguinolenta]
MEDLVERLEEKGRETADLVKMVENLSRRCDESDKARAELEEKIALVPNKEIFEVVEANAKYRKFMNELPNPEMPPPSFAQLEAICSSSANLYGYLSQNPAAQRFLSHILYLPKRLLSLPQSQLDYLAYGPTACYEASTQRWVDGSDLVRFHGGTRELFVEREGSIVYAGTYLCHDLRELHPAGTPPPADILPRTIIQAAFGALPYNHGQLIKQRYLDGKIKVEATGLKCVGFNIELYDVLRKRLAQEREKREKQKNKEVQKEKRKAGNEDLREGEKNKKSLLDFDF